MLLVETGEPRLHRTAHPIKNPRAARVRVVGLGMAAWLAAGDAVMPRLPLAVAKSLSVTLPS